MTEYQLTYKGSLLLDDAKRKGNIFPNDIYLLQMIDNGHKTKESWAIAEMFDLEECFNYLLENKYIYEL